MAEERRPRQEPATHDIVIERTFDAPRELVWRAWTDPDLMQRWWGPRGFTNPECALDPRPGGLFRVVMRGGEGMGPMAGLDLPCEGTFIEVTPPERLVYRLDHSHLPRQWHDAVRGMLPEGMTTLDMNHVQTITFEDLGGSRTRLTIRASFDSALIREAMAKIGMAEGWGESLEKLSEVIQTNEASERRKTTMMLCPYLMFPGTCREAMTFYAEVLGAKTLAMMTSRGTPMEAQTAPEDLDNIIHARIAIGGEVLMASDCPSQYYQKPTGNSVCLTVDTPEEADRIFAALAEGGQTTMEIAETFWAHRFGMTTDRFGTPWMISCEKPLEG